MERGRGTGEKKSMAVFPVKLCLISARAQRPLMQGELVPSRGQSQPVGQFGGKFYVRDERMQSPATAGT